ncbi:MAG: NusG domain II-containing protein [Acutalibacteraceae bacterium]|nr:NusG domain II-containing protein [Acutalibacteraceae bacterium]
MSRKLFTLLDVVLIFSVIFTSIVLGVIFSSRQSGKTAVISVEEKVVARLKLNINATEEIKTDYGYNLVVIENGECFIKNADCRDGICVSRGKINKVGESIVCLPHKLIVEIK